MSEIWPFDVWNKENLSPRDSSKSFKCFLLMPFEKRFDEVAQTIRDLVEKLVRSFPSLLPPTEPKALLLEVNSAVVLSVPQSLHRVEFRSFVGWIYTEE